MPSSRAFLVLLITFPFAEANHHDVPAWEIALASVSGALALLLCGLAFYTYRLRVVQETDARTCTTTRISSVQVAPQPPPAPTPVSGQLPAGPPAKKPDPANKKTDEKYLPKLKKPSEQAVSATPVEKEFAARPVERGVTQTANNKLTMTNISKQ